MTLTSHPVAGPLGVIFTVNNSLVSRAITGLSEDELWHRPAESSNPMFWLLGHIVHTRGALLRMLGEPYRTGWGDRFQRGAALKSRADYPALDDVERVRAETIERLLARLSALSEEELTREATGPALPASKTLGDQVAFLGLHEAYHVGQLGYIRKLLGRESIIG
jgi:uncharacterized damage-inducible protein DinB